MKKSTYGDLELPPNAEQLINALRQIGYNFEQAVSDLIDNCINAKAKNILIRIVYTDNSISKILVIDDGYGMTGSLLNRAMRFGAHEDSGDLSLGKFGMGMKLASFSQAKTLNVVTVSAGIRNGRRWSVEGISKNWICEGMATNEIDDLLNSEYRTINLARCGTIIEWSRIDRLPISKNGVNSTINQLFGRLRVHLGLHFHRFLENKINNISIILDSIKIEDKEADTPIKVVSLNPFDYEGESGDSNYPQDFFVKIPEVGEIVASAHIWPPNSKRNEYKLGNRAASRQGFYFYRNDRLIQAGGWNSVVEHESEPHTSLARIAIDLPESLDEHFGLNVQKSLVIVPPSFAASVQLSKSSKGTKFSEYRTQAQKVYRKKDKRAQRDYPLIPTGAIPAEVTRRAREIFSDNGKVREIEIVWADIDEPSMLFEITREPRTIRLDKRIRKKLLGSRRGSSVDLPLIKVLFFLLLSDDVEKLRSSAGRKKELSNISEILMSALKSES